MGFSSSQLVILKRCSKSIFKKLSLSNTDGNRRECNAIETHKVLSIEDYYSGTKPTNAIPDLMHQKKDLHLHANISTKHAFAENESTDINADNIRIKKPHPNRLLEFDQVSRSIPDIQTNRNDNILSVRALERYEYEQNRPASISTPGIPVQSILHDNDRFDLTYSESTTSNNSCSCSEEEEEEAISPSICTSGQWLSTESTNTTNRRSKSQENRTMIMIPSPFPNTDNYVNIFSTPATISYSTMKNNNLDRSHSQNSCFSTSSLDNLSSKSIFGESEFHRKESKAIRMWHTTVEKLAMQRRIAIALEQRAMKTKCNEKNSAVARFIISELYYTERSYYQFLLFIRSNYMEPMQNASQLKNPLVKPADVHILFYHLPDLIFMSEKLLGKLEIYAENGPINDVSSPGIAIGQIFKEMKDDFAVFLKYAIHYQGHMKAIRRASNTGYVIKIDRESKNCRKENNRLGLADYLIAPFQRVPRYELLLKDLLKHTNTSIKDGIPTHSLIEAKHIINALAATMNRVQEKISTSVFSASFYSSNSQSILNLVIPEQSSS